MVLFHRKHYFGPCLEKFYVVIFMDGPQRGGRRVISNLFLSKNLVRKVLDGLPYLMSQIYFPNNCFSLWASIFQDICLINLNILLYLPHQLKYLNIFTSFTSIFKCIYLISFNISTYLPHLLQYFTCQTTPQVLASPKVTVWHLRSGKIWNMRRAD